MTSRFVAFYNELVSSLTSDINIVFLINTHVIIPIAASILYIRKIVSKCILFVYRTFWLG